MVWSPAAASRGPEALRGAPGRSAGPLCKNIVPFLPDFVYIRFLSEIARGFFEPKSWNFMEFIKDFLYEFHSKTSNYMEFKKYFLYEFNRKKRNIMKFIKLSLSEIVEIN